MADKKAEEKEEDNAQEQEKKTAEPASKEEPAQEQAVKGEGIGKTMDKFQDSVVGVAKNGGTKVKGLLGRLKLPEKVEKTPPKDDQSKEEPRPEEKEPGETPAKTEKEEEGTPPAKTDEDKEETKGDKKPSPHGIEIKREGKDEEERTLIKWAATINPDGNVFDKCMKCNTYLFMAAKDEGKNITFTCGKCKAKFKLDK